MTDAADVLALRGLTFSYGERTVLRDCELRLGAGVSAGLLGRNGAGKTTLFRLVAGLLPAPSRTVTVAGRPAEAARRAGLVAFVPDSPVLYPRLTLEENLAAFALLWGLPARTARERADALLDRLDLGVHRAKSFQDLSRGMKQKANVVVGLLVEPRLLLLDEPTSGLDYPSVVALRHLLDEYVEGGGTLVLSSHAPDVLHAYVRRIHLLEDGHLTEGEDADAFFAAHRFERFFEAREGDGVAGG